MNSFSKLKVNKMKILYKKILYFQGFNHTCEKFWSTSWRGWFVSKAMWMSYAKTILRKVSSSFKRLNAYQERVAKKVIHVWAKHVCSGFLKQNVISELETLPDVESQINLSLFSWVFLKYPFPSRLTFKLLFRFKKVFLKYF